MTLIKKISTGIATGALAVSFMGLSSVSAFASDVNSAPPAATAPDVASDATYDLIFDSENPGKATMNANKAKFVERDGSIHVIDESGKDLGPLATGAETAEGDPLEVGYNVVSDTELEVIFSVPGSGAEEGASLRSSNITWQCGLSYATQIASTGSLIAAPFTGGASAVIGTGVVWAANGLLTYDACK